MPPIAVRALHSSMRHAPGRAIIPCLKRRNRPFRVLVLVTGVAGVGNLQRVGLHRVDEMERMSGHEWPARQFRQYCWHVTRNALATGAICLVMRMRFDGDGVRTVLTIWAVAGAANLVHGFAQHGLVLRAMWIVTAETGDAALIHQALHEIIALHPVFVRSAVRKMGEGCFTQFVLFKFPEIGQFQPGMVADGPIVVFALYGVR